MLEIKPHIWEEDGFNKKADCYPFVDGKPAPEIADCKFCKQDRPGNEFCNGWTENPGDAPLFCGPICPKFELIDTE